MIAGVAAPRNAGSGLPPKLAKAKLNQTTSGCTLLIARNKRQGFESALNDQQRITL